MNGALAKRTREAADVASELDVTRDPGEACLATFWRQAAPGGAYWRTQVPARHLPGQALPFEMSDLKWEGDPTDGHVILPRQRGAAVWQFLGDDRRSRVAVAQREQGVPTFMEVDDNYLRPWPALAGAKTWAKTHREAQIRGLSHSLELHKGLLPDMDGVICSTENLADDYSRFHDNIFVCPNSIDLAEWEHVERPEPDGILRIGYAGSPSHLQDYPLVKKALKWAGKQEGVEVVMIGFAPPGFRGTVVKWADDMAEYRQSLTMLDVGLCPIKPNPWANGKSDIKALEYAMAGVMPLVARAEPFAPWAWWDWGAQTEAEWHELIEAVIRDRHLVVGEAFRAREYVLRERLIEQNIHHWEEALRG